MSDAPTPEKLAELRKAFDPKVVGLLPKPYKKDSPKGECKECGKYHGLPAVHLDYVGHAAVTDRLLAVDPMWTWEPMATDEDGLPKTDRVGNLWIKLTVLGVTRIGVGDGANAKECIGDALRNAAMRFGVALDLWSKEELESSLVEPTMKNEKPSAEANITKAIPGAQPVEFSNGPTNKQLGMMKARFADLGITERDDMLDYTGKVVGRLIGSSTELTKAEAVKVIDKLLADLEDINGAAEPAA